MRSIMLLKGSVVAHVNRLPTGVVALQDVDGKPFLLIGPDGRVGDEHGETFDLSRAQESQAPRVLGSGRYDVQRYNDCEVSPLGFCIGDSETSECECIFCGEPEERK